MHEPLVSCTIETMYSSSLEKSPSFSKSWIIWATKTRSEMCIFFNRRSTARVSILIHWSLTDYGIFVKNSGLFDLQCWFMWALFSWSKPFILFKMPIMACGLNLITWFIIGFSNFLNNMWTIWCTQIHIWRGVNDKHWIIFQLWFLCIWN